MMGTRNPNHVNTFRVKQEDHPTQQEVVEVVEEAVDKPLGEELFQLTKKEQVKLLEELGLNKSKIKKLNTEKKRVDKILELYN